MKKLEEFYNESQTKVKTRYSIVESAIKVFSEDGIEKVKLNEIADSCEITLRNLYRYYPTKESLAVDAAYHIFYDASKADYTDIDSNTNGLEQLMVFLEQIIGHGGHNNLSQLTFIKFIMHFDLYLTTLDPHNESLIKYINTYVPNINDYGKNQVMNIVLKGIEDGSINIDIEEVDFYSEYIIQSLFSVTMRVVVKESENPKINKKLISKQIDVIKEYISKKS